jgi:hypothetical protein
MTAGRSRVTNTAFVDLLADAELGEEDIELAARKVAVKLRMKWRNLTRPSPNS